jgi:ABC-2 type transport system permease protein
VLSTDADLFGGFDMMSGQQRPRQPIVDELEKQYDVVQVDASAPITETYDVLLAVQPSSLGPEQMANFVAAVRAGQPVAIFEDPLPVLMTNVPGTSQPRRSPMGPMAMFGGPQGQPKGNLEELWQVLGVKLAAGKGRPAMGQMGAAPFVVYQDYNPHLKLELPAEFVFIDATLEGKDSGFSQSDAITAGLQEVLFPFPGAITKDEAADVTITPLVRTAASRSGTIEVDQVMGNRGDMRQLQIFERKADQSMVLAAVVERKPSAAAAPDAAGEKAAAARPIRAVVVADVDLLDGRIFGLRSRPDEVFGLDFDNVEFALNALDALAGDDRFIAIRKRKPKHRTLERIENAVADARDEADKQRASFIAKFDEAEREANDAMQKEVGAFEKKIKEMEAQGDADPQAAMQAIQQLASRQRLAQRRLDTKIEKLKSNRDAEVAAVERRLEGQVRREQDRQKWLAVLLPPIPPLVVAFLVFFRRRALEREGVAKSRLR